METKNREKLLLIVTGAMAGLYLLNLLVISPLIDSWHARSDEIVKLKKEIDDGNMLIRRGPSIQDTWDTMRANALPNNPTVAERQLFTSFDRWVNAGGVAEGSFRPEVQEGDTNYTTVDSRSDVSGSLENVRDFVRAMSRDPLGNKVQAFELAARDDNGRQLTLGLNLSGLILTGSDPSAIQAPPAAPTPAPDSNSTNTDADPFTIIARNNIFDQNRVYTDRYTRAPVHVPKVDTIACNGVASDHGRGQAFLDGSGVHTQDLINIGDTVADLKLAQVTKTTVTLTNATNSFTLPADGSETLRREDDGPWKLSGQIVETAPTTTTNSTDTNGTSATTTGATGGDSVLERLRKRHLTE